jgi:hypothetical protein
LSKPSPAADDKTCNQIIDKINFLLDVQFLATGVDQVEPLLEDLVDWIDLHPSCRESVAERFRELVAHIDADKVEILQYCMHALRWNEVHQIADELASTEKNVGRRRLYDRLLESFQDDWREKDLFRRYVK